MVRANILARASAGCLLACPLLILPPVPDVSRPSRVSILTTVVYCHLPPRAVGIPLRFNSSARARREMKPSALSSRRVEAKARARESAARLLANAPCIPRLREDLSPRACSIEPSWPELICPAIRRLVTRKCYAVRENCSGYARHLTGRLRKLVEWRTPPPALRFAREAATSVVAPAVAWSGLSSYLR